MFVEFLKANNMTEAAMLFSMFIIWGLLQHGYRFHGLKKYRQVTNGNPHPKCKITDDWKTEIRENIKEINKSVGKIKSVMSAHYGDE